MRLVRWLVAPLAAPLVALATACGSSHRETSAPPPSATVVTSTAPISVSRLPTPTPTPTPTRTSDPPLSAAARAAGLVDIRTVVPDAILDLRYKTSHNFVGAVLYPADARCLVHQSMVAGLKVAAARLRREGYLLVFWDCYRPHSVQVRMFEILPDPNWVARPGAYASSHEAARSVDVTLAHRSTSVACPPAQRIQRHCLLDMGTDFDDFTPRAFAFASGISPQARSDRTLLRSAMSDGGITVYSGEWWHFDGPGADVPRPHLNAPLH